MKTKICRKCGIEKDLHLFHKHSASKDGYENRCKKCRSEYDKEYDSKNKEKHMKSAMKWMNNNPESKKFSLKKHKKTDKYKNTWVKYYNKNKEKLKIVSKDWYKNNIERSREYERKRYENNVNFRIAKCLRARIYAAMTKGHKSASSIELLGCSIEFYKRYLEDYLLPEMNWDNHGYIWEIDHIIPCSSFDLIQKEEQLKAFNYINTQPLFITTIIAESFGYIDQIGNRNKRDKIS